MGALELREFQDLLEVRVLKVPLAPLVASEVLEAAVNPDLQVLPVKLERLELLGS